MSWRRRKQLELALTTQTLLVPFLEALSVTWTLVLSSAIWNLASGTGITGGEMREKGVEDISEDIRAENFPNLRKETDIQAQDT